MHKIIVFLLITYLAITLIEFFSKKILIRRQIGENKKISEIIIYAKLIRFFANSFLVISLIVLYINGVFGNALHSKLFHVSLPFLKYILGFFVERKIIFSHLKIKKSKLNKIILFTNLPELIITTFLIVWIMTGK